MYAQILLLHGSSALLHSSDSVPIIVALHGLAERPLVASTAWPSVSNHMSSGAILRMPPIGKNPERDDGNLCFGCGARHGYSADWLEEDHFINWAHSTGRGNWCRCCHLLHKASFKEFPEKKDLRKWQLDSPSHDAEFKAAHAAYVSVRRGGGAWKPNEHPRTMFQQEIGGRVRRPSLIYPDTPEGRKALWDQEKRTMEELGGVQRHFSHEGNVVYGVKVYKHAGGVIECDEEFAFHAQNESPMAGCAEEQLRPGAVASAWEQSRSAIAAQQNQGVEIPRTPLRDR